MFKVHNEVVFVCGMCHRISSINIKRSQVTIGSSDFEETLIYWGEGKVLHLGGGSANQPLSSRFKNQDASFKNWDLCELL